MDMKHEWTSVDIRMSGWWKLIFYLKCHDNKNACQLLIAWHDCYSTLKFACSIWIEIIDDITSYARAEFIGIVIGKFHFASMIVLSSQANHWTERVYGNVIIHTIATAMSTHSTIISAWIHNQSTTGNFISGSSSK